MSTFGTSLTMKQLKHIILLALTFWISDVPAVDLSGITPQDMQLFFNYLALTPPLIAGMVITPVSLYHAGVWLISAIYSAFSR